LNKWTDIRPKSLSERWQCAGLLISNKVRVVGWNSITGTSADVRDNEIWLAHQTGHADTEWRLGRFARIDATRMSSLLSLA
jgi:hypothetical protein